ncbi:uncharacterized protein [Dysidea avara]|uniref:uncharacterized protein n=1 Tax=Dysidea avara TaxID=196820 RepID=UPI003330F9D2
MSSYEPKRTSAYSKDLRWRLVYQWLGLGFTFKTIASNLVDPSTVLRTVELFLSSGDVEKKKYEASNLKRKVTDELRYFMMHVVLDTPGIMLHEIQKEIENAFNMDITICRALHQLNFSRMKMRIAATQQDDLLRSYFTSEIAFYKANMFVFLDETGTDRRDAIRKYGYGWRGKPIVANKLLFRGQHLSTLALMSTAGLLDCMTVSGGVNGDVFYEFIHTKLLPHLNPFDGSSAQSIVIMDNALIHSVNGIVEMIQQVGAIVMFLPPYSPDFNPIEEMFSKVKKTIKWYEKSLQSNEMDLKTVIQCAFCHVTPEDCCGWIASSGIYQL